jgi:hypothetical protein
MQLMGNRSLAWGLRLTTEVVLVAWLLLMGVVLVVMFRQRSQEGDGSRQGTVFVELKLPPEIVQAADPHVTVFNVEADRTRIHYQSPANGNVLDLVQSLGRVVIGWGIFALILWNLRQILASLVARQPLTVTNARRFRTISLLMVLSTAYFALSRTVEYLRLQALFPLIPERGFFGLFGAHVDWPYLFTALLILLMADVLRLGAAHRADSEAVI